jgi:hypothetical protein
MSGAALAHDDSRMQSAFTGVPVAGRMPRRAMDMPVDSTSTGRAAEPIVWPETSRRPGRPIELHLVDLPIWDASFAEQEDQRDGTVDGEQLGRPDVDVADPCAACDTHAYYAGSWGR